MAKNNKQRKKTEKQVPTTTDNNDDDDDNGEAISVPKQLERAQLAVERNQEAALNLHDQWRTHLLRMSYVVMVVTFHQAQTPSTSCIKEIKEWNSIQTSSAMEDQLISGYRAIVLVFHNSIVELLGIVCAGCLLWCLRMTLPPGASDFSTIPYRLSCSIIPMIVSLYFSKKNLGCIAGGSISSTEEMEMPTLEDLKNPGDRNFPVVLVFHTLVSLSLCFMQYQNAYHDKNINMVLQMKKDLRDAQITTKQDKKKH